MEIFLSRTKTEQRTSIHLTWPVEEHFQDLNPTPVAVAGT
jgi:hypothetical protein